MMRGEAIATYKLSEEMATGTFHCPPHFSNSDIEPQPVPNGWPWIERKAHTYITMKLRREFNAGQGGAASNFHALYASCQSKASALAYTIAKAVLQDKKDPEPKYANIQ
uniref:Uncharacterized protein n=1 Tax=Romanomermis culicivorax TaxID=13658 RepID=A0A915L289_ROMCU